MERTEGENAWMPKFERVPTEREKRRNLGPLAKTCRMAFCPLVSQDGRQLYLTSDRSGADNF